MSLLRGLNDSSQVSTQKKSKSTGSSWGQENDSFEGVKMTLELTVWHRFSYRKAHLKALSHAAIFLAICNAILLFGDVKLANACFHPVN